MTHIEDDMKDVVTCGESINFLEGKRSLLELCKAHIRQQYILGSQKKRNWDAS